MNIPTEEELRRLREYVELMERLRAPASPPIVAPVPVVAPVPALPGLPYYDPWQVPYGPSWTLRADSTDAT